MSLLVIIGLLVLPFIAGHRRGVDFPMVAAYGMLLNAVTYWVYARDKRRAEEGERLKKSLNGFRAFELGDLVFAEPSREVVVAEVVGQSDSHRGAASG